MDKQGAHIYAHSQRIRKSLRYVTSDGSATFLSYAIVMDNLAPSHKTLLGRMGTSTGCSRGFHEAFHESAYVSLLLIGYGFVIGYGYGFPRVHSHFSLIHMFSTGLKEDS